MLKTPESTEATIWPREGKIGVGDDGKAKWNSKCKFDDSEIGDDKVGKKDQKTSKSKNSFKFKKLFKSKKMIESLNFLSPRARLVFTKLK